VTIPKEEDEDPVCIHPGGKPIKAEAGSSNRLPET